MTLSKTAKAVAVLQFINFNEGFDNAVTLYDALAMCYSMEGDLNILLNAFPNAYLLNSAKIIPFSEWFEEIKCLAVSVDAARAQFNE